MNNPSASPGSGAAVGVASLQPVIPDFELVRIVGRGSYGDVWLARSVTGAWRAIKVVWRARFADAGPFEREFRGLKEFAEISLGESSQVALLHVGRNDASGFFYYVMELADDAERDRHIDPAAYVPLTLAEMRARRGRIPARECVRLGAEVARGLASLHRRGLVHRDIKPSNVIVVNGSPKLADIGLVAPVDSARTFVGTESYVPPDGPGNPGADVFALGKVLYELSTGHDRQEFPRLPADLARLPDRGALLELNEVLLRACAPAPEQRYLDGSAMLEDLTALHGGVSLRTRRLTTFLLRAAASIALVAALGVGAWYWAARPASEPPPVAAGISPRSVAVLPFVNASGDPSHDPFAAGIGDEVLHALERESDLRVTGSRSASWAGAQKLSDVEIARALRVAFLVEGSVHRDGSRIRMDVHLTRGFDGASETLGSFEGDLREVFGLQDAVARAVARKLLNRVTMPPLVPSTKVPEAYDAYLRGRVVQLGLSASSAESAKHAEAARHFERAVELDPAFAVAWARLAEARHRTEGVFHAESGSPDSSVATIEHALSLQPELAVSWTVSGYIRGVGQGDTALGLRDLVRAEELGGPNAETRMLRFLVIVYAGEIRGLLPLAREAIASNPENTDRIDVVPKAMATLGDFAESDRLFRQWIAVSPNSSVVAIRGRARLRRQWRGGEAALHLLAHVPPEQTTLMLERVNMLAGVGRLEEAEKLLEESDAKPTMDAWLDVGRIDRARELAQAGLPGFRRRYETRELHPRTDRERGARDEICADLILAEHLVGHHEEARALLVALRAVVDEYPSNRRAIGIVGQRLPRILALMGQPEAALEILRDIQDGGYCPGYELRDSPAYALLRGHPEFLELRRQAEAWADRQPDPPDDPPADVRPTA